MAGKATKCLALSIWMLAFLAGCGGSPDLKQPTDEALAREILPMDLPAATPTPPPPAPKFLTHVVREEGETYMAIARWYTGDGENWKRIAEANPDVEPRYIRIGNAIRIPEELLVTRRPMPRRAPAPQESHPAPTATPKPPKPTPAPVELYGPVGTPAIPVKPAPADGTPELEPLGK